MRRVVRVAAAGAWQPAAAVATVTLAYDDRCRRRIAMADDAGAPFLLDLPHATRLRDGDGLVLDGGGGIIAVRAAIEPVIDVHGADAAATARLAWHLGNRHAAIEVLADGGLRIRADAVLGAMAEGLGARIERRSAAFEPEAGAYAHGGSPVLPHGHAGGDD